jgi:hypothetical protein
LRYEIARCALAVGELQSRRVRPGVQNMNLMLAYPETIGLEQVVLLP